MSSLGIPIDGLELKEYFGSSEFLKANGYDERSASVEFREGVLSMQPSSVNSYLASVLSDYLRRKLLSAGKSFTFETVMSSPDKVDFLREAHVRGYRTYLYFVATEDPAINIDRVKFRIAKGGHPVPEDKITARYHRSLGLLRDAIRHTNRAYFFDTSGESTRYFAEITDGVQIELKSSETPDWFTAAVWDKR